MSALVNWFNDLGSQEYSVSQVGRRFVAEMLALSIRKTRSLTSPVNTVLSSVRAQCISKTRYVGRHYQLFSAWGG